MAGATDGPCADGGGAASPPAESSGWRLALRGLKRRMWAHNAPLVATGVAFFGVLSVFPAIGAALAALGLLIEPDFIQSEIDRATAVIPRGGISILREQARQVVSDQGADPALILALGCGGVAIAAGRAMKMLMNGMNAAYDVAEDRGVAIRNLAALLLTALAVSVALMAFAVIISAPPVVDELFPGRLGSLILWARWPMLAALTIFGLGLLYRLAPNRRAPSWRAVAPGALAATLFWTAGSVAFSFYVANFGSFSTAYGVLGGVMILMLWMWVTAFIVLMGAELNAELEAGRRGAGAAKS